MDFNKRRIAKYVARILPEDFGEDESSENTLCIFRDFRKLGGRQKETYLLQRLFFPARSVKLPIARRYCKKNLELFLSQDTEKSRAMIYSRKYKGKSRSRKLRQSPGIP